MSAKGKALLEEFSKLPPPEQRELLQRLAGLANSGSGLMDAPFPAITVPGGTITAEQVASAMDDE